MSEFTYYPDGRYVIGGRVFQRITSPSVYTTGPRNTTQGVGNELAQHHKDEEGRSSRGGEHSSWPGDREDPVDRFAKRVM